MSETNYKLNVTSVEIKDPQDFSYSFSSSGVVTKISDNSTVGTIAANQYFFEQVTTTQSIKEFGETRTIYHGQSLFKISSTPIVFPLWELVSSVSGSSIHKINIGRVTLLITFLDTAANSANTQLLRVVTSNQTNSGSTASLVNGIKTASADTIETNASLGKKNFYIDGRSAVATATSSNTTSTSDVIKYTIDFNNYLTSQTNGRYFTLGLETGSTLAESLIKIESYVEVIS